MWYQNLGYVPNEQREKYIRPFKEDFKRVLDPRIGDGFYDNVELI